MQPKEGSAQFSAPFLPRKNGCGQRCQSRRAPAFPEERRGRAGRAGKTSGRPIEALKDGWAHTPLARLPGRSWAGRRGTSTHPGDTWGPCGTQPIPVGTGAHSTPTWPRRRRCRSAESGAPLPATCPASAELRYLLLPLPPFVPSSLGGGPQTKGPAPPSASASGERDSPAGPTRPSRFLLPPPQPC